MDQTTNTRPAASTSALDLAIREIDEQSEILSAAVLLAWSMFFLGLYLAAPKGFTNKQPFEAIPIVFGIYIPLLLLRLGLAMRRALSAPLSVLGALLDVTMLCSLIWLWHLQYEQPAPFYLKAPTFGTLFLIVALRALTYRPVYILSTGIFATLGWIVLVAYAAKANPELVTRNFVEYSTGHRILLGAEFEKVLILLSVTLVLSLAMYRARRLLYASVKNAHVNRSFARFFSEQVAGTIEKNWENLRPGVGQRRKAAILMMDLRGFTAMSSLTNPDPVIQLISEYQARMVGPIVKNRGCIDKFMGDGILAHFGAAADSQTYAADCMRAVDALIACIRAWNRERSAKGETPLRFGIGIASGEVIFGLVGDKDRLEFTTIGDPVNLSAKLEKHTKIADAVAVTTQLTLDTAVAQGYQSKHSISALQAQEVAGVPAPIALVALDIFPNGESKKRSKRVA